MNSNTVEILRDYKMNCDEIKDLSSDYIDSNCDSFNSMAIFNHIEQCESCEKFINDMEQLKTWSKSLSETTISADVSLRLREKLGLV